MDGIDGLAASDPVAAEQMRALFGCGLHPLAALRQQQLEGPDLTLRDFEDASRLGAVQDCRQRFDPVSGRGGQRIAALNAARWVAETADHILAVMEESRST
jgi:hypothetical protein